MYPKVSGNPDATSVVNERQYLRINSLLSDARDKGATIVPLADDSHDEQNRQMPLTIVTGVTGDMKVMQQEIFGPVLPIVEYETLDQAIDYVNQHDRPLALYVCSFNKATQNKILKSTHSGGVCINDAALHVGVDDLPFGGVGPSGMGNYHGVEGFKTFSHAKAIFERGRFTTAPLLFPPFGRWVHKLVYKMFIK
jgi:coniferyl-aldehyde dehydrogenase